MSKGWPMARPRGRAPRSLVVPLLGLALIGCAQGQKRPGFFGAPPAKPPIPRTAANRPEPGLRVRAPFVDVQVADRDEKKPEDRTPDEAPAISSRMGLFRSSSAPRSLEGASPLN